MKALACLVLAAGAVAGPLASFAQSTAAVTHEQVRADLIRLEAAGYHVGDGDEATYCAEIQAAEAKVAAQDGQQMAVSAVGGTTINGTSAAGSRQDSPVLAPSSCVGPVSHCNIYFGN